MKSTPSFTNCRHSAVKSGASTATVTRPAYSRPSASFAASKTGAAAEQEATSAHAATAVVAAPAASAAITCSFTTLGNVVAMPHTFGRAPQTLGL
jgi:hypothetical protein